MLRATLLARFDKTLTRNFCEHARFVKSLAASHGSVDVCLVIPAANRYSCWILIETSEANSRHHTRPIQALAILRFLLGRDGRVFLRESGLPLETDLRSSTFQRSLNPRVQLCADHLLLLSILGAEAAAAQYGLRFDDACADLGDGADGAVSDRARDGGHLRQHGGCGRRLSRGKSDSRNDQKNEALQVL